MPSGTAATATAVIPEGGVGDRHLTQTFESLERLENKHLQQQRFVPSQKKSDDLSKLSLGAKVERALGRRMSDQDAVFRVKRPAAKTSNSFPFIDEKVALKI